MGVRKVVIVNSAGIRTVAYLRYDERACAIPMTVAPGLVWGEDGYRSLDPRAVKYEAPVVPIREIVSRLGYDDRIFSKARDLMRNIIARFRNGSPWVVVPASASGDAVTPVVHLALLMLEKAARVDHVASALLSGGSELRPMMMDRVQSCDIWGCPLLHGLAVPLLPIPLTVRVVRWASVRGDIVIFVCPFPVKGRIALHIQKMFADYDVQSILLHRFGEAGRNE